MRMDGEVIEAARKWLELDKDPESRSRILQMMDNADYEGLGDLMLPRIAFGTSGLRAEMAPGFSRMNAVTVQIACQVRA